MSQLARKYLKEEYGFAYQGSLFSMKPILKASEIDDSRPTVVRVMNTEPMLVSVLSGKINTVYDAARHGGTVSFKHQLNGVRCLGGVKLIHIIADRGIQARVHGVFQAVVGAHV